MAELVWLMIPAYCANMAPPFVRFWHGWNPPINDALFGAHKTVVGFAVAVLVALIVSFAQSQVIVPLLWDRSGWLAIGLAQGIGAMGGDAIKSFCKRRIGIAPGHAWVPADQLDSAIGALALISFRVALSWTDVALILALTFVADIVVNHVSYALGIRTTRW